MQRDLEGAGHVEHVDALARHAQARHLFEEGVARLVDDLRMPLGFDQRDAPVAACHEGGEGKVVELTHGLPLVGRVA